MRIFKRLLPLLILLIVLIWAVPAFIRAMPDRYVMRLPEPLQQIGLPESKAALLPTVERPLETQNLLLPGTTTPVVEDTSGATAEVESAAHTPSPAAVAPAERSPALADEQAAQPPTPAPLPTSTAWPLPSASRLDGIQHKFQTWNNCGPATLAMALTHFDINVSQDETAAILKPDPEDRNVTPEEMAGYVNEQTPYRALFRVDGNRELLRRFVANGIPVIVEIGIEPPGEFRWLGWYGHYLLVVAYDDEQEQFWVYDSWLGTSEVPLENANPDGRTLTYQQLDEFWPQKKSEDNN